MTGYIILGVVLGLPLLLGLLFRVNTPHLFFSLMAGELLARYFGDDAERFISALSRNHTAGAYGEAAVLILPVVLTALLLKGTMSKGRVVLQLVPLAITGVVLAAFLLPILPDAVQNHVRELEIGRRLLDRSDLIVGIVVLFQLVTLWLLNRSREHGKKHHK